MTFNEYLSAAAITFRFEPTWRVGQAYFNALEVNRPDIARKIRDSLVDPFYDDGKLADFLQAVERSW